MSLLVILQTCLFFMMHSTAAAPQPPVRCRRQCGNVSIPYPFGIGIGSGCYLDEGFRLSCNTTFDIPKPFIGDGNIEVLKIFTDEGQLCVNKKIAKECYSAQGELRESASSSINLQGTPYKFSDTRNRFVAIGCDTFGYIIDNEPDSTIRFRVGCESYCDTLEYVGNGSCDGVGCCQVRIPRGVQGFSISSGSYNNHSTCWKFSPCSYSLLIDDDSFKFMPSNFTDLINVTHTPLMLDWSIGNKTCSEARKNEEFACVSENSHCYQDKDVSGYRCLCSVGYAGNPYLLGGCNDIDECKHSPCATHAQCENYNGSYTCICDSSMKGDGQKNGTGCSCKPGTQMMDSGHCKDIAKFPRFAVAIGVTSALVFLCGNFFWSYWALKKRNLIKLKEKFFQQNGGFLLQRQISEADGSTTGLKIFSSRELSEATDNFTEDRILGKGGFGTVYKGILPDGRTIAVKKSKITDEEQKEQFINEVVILSHINHRNVVKLIGCCLETPVPLLIYEFVSNGTLSEHIHGERGKGSFSLERRMRIAVEISEALAYLHSSTSTPIIHRDVKCSNILLDDNYVSKVSDFGMSRLVPFDQDCINSLVRGTFGYLDPEYLQSGQFTDKSDVYSFGVILAELLTGEKAVLENKMSPHRSLASYFLTYYNEGQLQEILEERVRAEGQREQLLALAEIVKQCLCVKSEERPTMKEVSKDLEELMRNNHPWIQKNGEADSILMKSLLYEPGLFGASGCFSEGDSSDHPMIGR